MALNQKAIKVLGKVFEAGFTDEKSIAAMTMDDILAIQGITIADIGIINELQKGGFDFDKNAYIESLVNTSVLILDDLGIERDTSYAKEQVYNIVNNRYLKQKPTIFTTNLSYDTIQNCKDSVEYQRIYSRIIEMCIPVMVVGEDFRKVIQKDKLNRNKDRLLNGGERS